MTTVTCGAPEPQQYDPAEWRTASTMYIGAAVSDDIEALFSASPRRFTKQLWAVLGPQYGRAFNWWTVKRTRPRPRPITRDSTSSPPLLMVERTYGIGGVLVPFESFLATLINRWSL
jgi:hypothetical protein